MNNSRDQYQYITDFIAEAACYAEVAKTMNETLVVLEVIHRAGIVVDEGEYALDFSCEILKLKAALRVMGLDDGDGSGTKQDF